jgi:hypothetical protein
MDLQSRKIEFIQEFLKLKSEEAIAKFEALLKTENAQFENPFSKEELIGRIQQSESDFNNGRKKTSEELLRKYKS